MKGATEKQRAEFERSNLISARIILADTDKFGGDEALAVRWARAFMAGRQQQHTTERKKAA